MHPESATVTEMQARAKARRRKGKAPNDDDELYGPWVEDDLRLMDLPQWKIGSVLQKWPKDLVFRADRTEPECDVFYNPCAFICTNRFKEGVSAICGNDVEWLPVIVEPVGEMYVFHPLRTATLGRGSEYRQNGVSGNIVEIRKHDFEDPSNLPPCFLIPQPPESPSGTVGRSTLSIYVTDQLRNKMWPYRGIDFACVFEKT
jgi:hypothetical protein